MTSLEGGMMQRELYRYSFESEVPIEDVEASLVLAVLAAESLHGEAQVRLDAAHHLDLEKHVCVMDASTPVGKDVNRMFLGFLTREFGDGLFTVERCDAE